MQSHTTHTLDRYVNENIQDDLNHFYRASDGNYFPQNSDINRKMGTEEAKEIGNYFRPLTGGSTNGALYYYAGRIVRDWNYKGLLSAFNSVFKTTYDELVVVSAISREYYKDGQLIKTEKI